MTKTKKQLRAEAVERLKMLDEYGGGSFEYAILGSDKIAWRYMDKRDALIDLLTDDDAGAESAAQDMDNGICVHMCPYDSREKLEADVRDYYRIGLPGIQETEINRIYYNQVLEWLDRQAAITERETTKRHELFCETCEAESDKQIAELKAERDKLQEQLLIGWECECRLQAERERYRDLFGKCLDYADAIHALMDDEGMA